MFQWKRSDNSKQSFNHKWNIIKTVLAPQTNAQPLIRKYVRWFHSLQIVHIQWNSPPWISTEMFTKSPLPTSQQIHHPLGHIPMDYKQTTKPIDLRIITLKEQMVRRLPIVLAHATPLDNTNISLPQIIHSKNLSSSCLCPFYDNKLHIHHVTSLTLSRS